MNENNNQNKTPNPNRKYGLIGLGAALLIFMLFLYFSNLVQQSTHKEITYNEFISMIEQGKIDSVDIESSEIIIYPKAEKSYII